MDSITHAIIGAAVGHTLFARKLGRQAAAIGAFAGLLPDVDSLISSKSDPLLYVEYHRYFTHSLLFAGIGALIAVLPWIFRAKFFRENRIFLWLCALTAYLSHCLLDACTTYGTQIYWPFSRERIGWDYISIIDPIFTITTLALLVVGVSKHRTGFTAAAMAFALAYIGFGAIQRSRAAEAQRILAHERNHVIERSEIMPTLGNNLVWRSLYLTDGKIHSDRIRVGWFSSATVRSGASAPLTTAADLNASEGAANKHTHGFERFAWFSDNWLARSPIDPTVLGDMRYSISTQAFDPVWGIRLSNLQGQEPIEWVNRSRERRPQIKELWAEISGNHSDYRVLR